MMCYWVFRVNISASAGSGFVYICLNIRAILITFSVLPITCAFYFCEHFFAVYSSRTFSSFHPGFSGSFFNELSMWKAAAGCLVNRPSPSRLAHSASAGFSLAHVSLFVTKFSVFSCNTVLSQCDVPALIFSIRPGSS